MASSSLIFALSHLYLGLLSQYWPNYEPSYRCVFAFILYGFSYSLYTTSIWPCVPYFLPNQRYVVERKVLGSAYGILVAIENTGFTIGPLLVAAMSTTKYKEGYFAVSMLNFAEALVGAGFSFYILYYDITHSRVLISDSKRAVAIQKHERAKHKAEVKAVQAPVITGL